MGRGDFLGGAELTGGGAVLEAESSSIKRDLAAGVTAGAGEPCFDSLAFAGSPEAEVEGFAPCCGAAAGSVEVEASFAYF